MHKLQKQGFWLHIAQLCVLLLLLSGFVQATHSHGSERNANHCASCVAGHSPAIISAVPNLAVDTSDCSVIATAQEKVLPSRPIAGAYIRPPPTL
jgi:hypothetical protein